MPEKTQKRNTGLRIAALVLALLCGVGIGLLLPKLQNASLFRSRAAVRCREKNFSLSQTEFAYYYWTEYYYFADVYGAYLGTTFDLNRPLSEQTYSETQTWQDYMTERTLTSVRETTAMVFAAQEAGYVLREPARQSLLAEEQKFRDAAAKQNYESLDAYLADSFGKGAAEKSFFAYLEQVHLAADYAAYLKEQIAPDEKTVAAYYEAHRDAYAEEPDPLGAAKADYIDEEYRNTFLSVTDRYTFEADYQNIAAAIAAAEKNAEASAESVKK